MAVVPDRVAAVAGRLGVLVRGMKTYMWLMKKEACGSRLTQPPPSKLARPNPTDSRINGMLGSWGPRRGSG